MILADKLIQLRKKAGWSQEELAEQMQVSRQAVSKWESAQSVPDLEKLLRLSRLFGVSTDYLLKDELETVEYVDTPESTAALKRSFTLEQAHTYLELRSSAAKRIALATFLCVLSPIPLLLSGGFFSRYPYLLLLSLIGLFGLVACAVVLFITTGNQSAEYEFLDRETFDTAYGVEGFVRERQKALRSGYTRSNIIAACICILSPIPLLIGAFYGHNPGSVVMTLCITILLAGLGATLFILAGVPWAATQKLLQEGDYSPEKKRAAKLSEAVSMVYWLLATACYLAWSFTTNSWDRSWILWPVAGVVYAAVLSVTQLIGERRK